MQKGRTSGIAFGIALAGFWDGISLHSILQWHHMISGKISPDTMAGMRTNMVADGLFDLFCWIVTIVALALLFRDAKHQTLPRAKIYVGWILLGAGLFNLVEGIIDHEILQVHHVRPGPHWLAWDIGFLLVGGVLLMAIGWYLRREEPRRLIPLSRAA